MAQLQAALLRLFSSSPYWLYKDELQRVQGPFSSAQMMQWFTANRLPSHLPCCGVTDDLAQSVQAGTVGQLVPVMPFESLQLLLTRAVAGQVSQPVSGAALRQAVLQQLMQPAQLGLQAPLAPPQQATVAAQQAAIASQQRLLLLQHQQQHAQQQHAQQQQAQQQQAQQQQAQRQAQQAAAAATLQMLQHRHQQQEAALTAQLAALRGGGNAALQQQPSHVLQGGDLARAAGAGHPAPVGPAGAQLSRSASLASLASSTGEHGSCLTRDPARWLCDQCAACCALLGSALPPSACQTTARTAAG
jgi:hypothetical protein